MPKTIKEERLRWVLPVANKEIKLVDATKVCPHGKRTLERWVANYKKHGEAGLEPESTRPKTNPRETSIRIKERIIELRKETKLCARKLVWRLEKESVVIGKNTIQKIIKKEGLVRKYRIRKLKYKYVPELVSNTQYYQFTAIDCASRWRYLKVYDNYSNSDSIDFLETLIRIAPFRILAIKTDNGPNFTNRYLGYPRSSDPQNPKLHPLDQLCQKYNIIHYLIDSGKPAQNGKVERSHRTDQEMFYEHNKFNTFDELKQKIAAWNIQYNDLEHCSLGGKTPNEMLEILTNDPPNVCG